MSGLHFDSMEDMPEGLRRILEKQLSKGKKEETSPRVVNPEPSILLPAEKGNRRKYHNLPTERLLPNGECIKFGSKKEAAYYDSLRVQEQAGVVKDIKLQYEFLIKPAYTDGATGERFRAVTYLADFHFKRLCNGEWKTCVVDTKGGGRRGTKTQTYIIKRKLLAEMGIIIEEA